MANNCRSLLARQRWAPSAGARRHAVPSARVVRSAFMSSPKRGWLAIAAVALVGAGAQLSPATAVADPNSGTQTQAPPAQGDQLQHNVTYRARADGTSRGAVVAYKIDDTNV